MLKDLKSQLRKRGDKLWLLPFSNARGESGISDETVSAYALATGHERDAVAKGLEKLRVSTFNKKVAQLKAGSSS